MEGGVPETGLGVRSGGGEERAELAVLSLLFSMIWSLTISPIPLFERRNVLLFPSALASPVSPLVFFLSSNAHTAKYREISITIFVITPKLIITSSTPSPSSSPSPSPIPNPTNPPTDNKKSCAARMFFSPLIPKEWERERNSERGRMECWT